MSSLVACQNKTNRERGRERETETEISVIIGQARNDLTNEEVFRILIFDT